MRAVLPPLLALLVSTGAAIQSPLDRRAIEEALDIAHSTIEAMHHRFHADYRFKAGRAPVDSIAIVTPFRRLVLSAETAQRSGRRLFGQREALAALEPDPARVEVFVELTFHPHNVFIGVPEYGVELMPVSAAGPPLQPENIDRVPRFGPRLDTPWHPYTYPPGLGARTPAGGPLIGATLIAAFDGARLDPNGVYAVVVKDGTSELIRVRVDFARLR